MLCDRSRRDTSYAWEECSVKQREGSMIYFSSSDSIVSVDLVRRDFTYTWRASVKELWVPTIKEHEIIHKVAPWADKSKFEGYKGLGPTWVAGNLAKERWVFYLLENYRSIIRSEDPGRGAGVPTWHSLTLVNKSRGICPWSKNNRSEISQGLLWRPTYRCIFILVKKHGSDPSKRSLELVKETIVSSPFKKAKREIQDIN